MGHVNGQRGQRVNPLRAPIGLLATIVTNAEADAVIASKPETQETATKRGHCQGIILPDSLKYSQRLGRPLGSEHAVIRGQGYFWMLRTQE